MTHIHIELHRHAVPTLSTVESVPYLLWGLSTLLRHVSNAKSSCNKCCYEVFADSCGMLSRPHGLLLRALFPSAFAENNVLLIGNVYAEMQNIKEKKKKAIRTALTSTRMRRRKKNLAAINSQSSERKLSRGFRGGTFSGSFRDRLSRAFAACISAFCGGSVRCCSC